MTVYTPRRASRVLLVDAAGRVLLFGGFDPARPDHRYWFTPGGGLDPGETYAICAARELAEETGLRLPPEAFGAPVHRDVTEFPFDGVWYRQEQEFFLVRVDAHAVDTAGFNDVERACVPDHRWWSVDELTASGQRYYPADLPAVLARALAGGVVPSSPTGGSAPAATGGAPC
ncbi:NUDIX hydrolase [Micromonospora endolithica]|uniref:NUDIX domain-containing protein n=1 Tax=Micromonospora endolithica TaxID=230091 RepID=A0A3A9ZN39_9ACTN|nr:NUDIX domain-containing protein [Micromonospora endolithica]RKN49324.1 NUDIX domain-containing protein [Micromonospora endolithica]